MLREIPQLVNLYLKDNRLTVDDLQELEDKKNREAGLIPDRRNRYNTNDKR